MGNLSVEKVLLDKPIAQSTWKGWTNDKCHESYMALYRVAKGINDKLEASVKSYEASTKQLQIKLAQAESRVEQLQNSLTIFVTDEYTKKQILRLYAKGNSSLQVYKILTEVKNQDVDFKTVSDIITNLKNGDLETEYLEYYKEESEKFLSSVSGYEEEYRLGQIRQIMENNEVINSLIADIKKEKMIDDDKMRNIAQLLSLMKAQGDNVKVLSGIMKNSNASNFGNESENTSQKVADKTQEENLGILKNFDPTKLVTVN